TFEHFGSHTAVTKCFVNLLNTLSRSPLRAESRYAFRNFRKVDLVGTLVRARAIGERDLTPWHDVADERRDIADLIILGRSPDVERFVVNGGAIGCEHGSKRIRYIADM